MFEELCLLRALLTTHTRGRRLRGLRRVLEDGVLNDVVLLVHLVNVGQDASVRVKVRTCRRITRHELRFPLLCFEKVIVAVE